MIIRYRNVPGSCRFCGDIQASEVCDRCAAPRPARPHPKRCQSCGYWACIRECPSLNITHIVTGLPTFRAVAA